MHVCFLANIESSHIKNWSIQLLNHNIKLSIISCNPSKLNGAHFYQIKPISPNIKFFPFRFLFSLYDGFKIRSLLHKINADVIHMHQLNSQIMWFWALLFKKNIIISTWGSDVILTQNKFHNIAKWLILNQAKIITATSDYLAKITAKYTKKDINIIPFGIDTNFFKPERKKQKNLTLGFAKGLKKLYGIYDLLEAFKLLKEENGNIRLIITGKGTEFNNIQNYINYNNLQDRVTLLEYLLHKNMATFYNSIDIFVMPSHSEAFGVAALEAQACEIPVVATNVGGIKEAVIHKKTGILIERNNVNKLADAIQLLINHPHLRNKYGQQGRKFVLERYQSSKSTLQMIECYSKIATHS